MNDNVSRRTQDVFEDKAAALGLFVSDASLQRDYFSLNEVAPEEEGQHNAQANDANRNPDGPAKNKVVPTTFVSLIILNGDETIHEHLDNIRSKPVATKEKHKDSRQNEDEKEHLAPLAHVALREIISYYKQ